MFYALRYCFVANSKSTKPSPVDEIVKAVHIIFLVAHIATGGTLAACIGSLSGRWVSTLRKCCEPSLQVFVESWSERRVQKRYRQTLWSLQVPGVCLTR